MHGLTSSVEVLGLAERQKKGSGNVAWTKSAAKGLTSQLISMLPLKGNSIMGPQEYKKVRELEFGVKPRSHCSG